MVGGGRRDEPLGMSNTNVFAALGTLRKKKKATDKDQVSSSKNKGKKAEKEVEKKEVYWAPAPLTVKSWADVDDDDDDDYYATAAAPENVWAAPKEPEPEPTAEESESEEEGLDEVYDEGDEEHENEPEAPVETDPVDKKTHEAPPAQKENDRQLSKKELKKKELEELDAVLAELGLAKKEAIVTDGIHVAGAGEDKNSESNGEMEKKEDLPAESKNAKKKKKKDKSLKDVKGSSQGQLDGNDIGNGSDDTGGPEKPEDASAVDVKERLKKVATAKKKKSSKEMDAAGRAAASEAAIRSAKLAAAKKKEKKEKSQYNQQPVR